MTDARTDAMEVVLTWGPERMKPEAERLRERQPEISEDEIRAALAEAWKVMSEAEAAAGGIKRGGPSPDLLKDRPWLTDDQASRAVQQGLYSHWRDTGE